MPARHQKLIRPWSYSNGRNMTRHLERLRIFEVEIPIMYIRSDCFRELLSASDARQKAVSPEYSESGPRLILRLRLCIVHS